MLMTSQSTPNSVEEDRLRMHALEPLNFTGVWMKGSHSLGMAWRLVLAPGAKVLGTLGTGYIER